MPDKINGQGFRPLDTAGARRSGGSPRPDAAASTSSGSAGSSEQVDVTSSSLLLNRLEEALQSSPAVDAQRVRAVRDAIASGTYQIDAALIAEKIIQLEQDLNF